MSGYVNPVFRPDFTDYPAAPQNRLAQFNAIWPASNPVGTETTQGMQSATPVDQIAFMRPDGTPVMQSDLARAHEQVQTAMQVAPTMVLGMEGARPGFPMDEASRLQRAREMGFDTSRTLYHATPYDFSEFVPSSWRGATYFADNPTAAARGAAAGGMEHPALSGPTGSGEATGARVIPAYTAGKIWGRDPLPEGWLPERLDYGQYKAIVNGQDKITLPGLSDAENAHVNYIRQDAAKRHYTEAVPESEYHRFTGDNENKLPMKLESPPVARPFGYESIEGGDRPSAFGPSDAMAPAARRDLLQKLGYSGWMVKDEAGNSVAIADPSKIRSIFANFDPSKAGSRNILAGGAGALAVGTAAGTQQQSQ